MNSAPSPSVIACGELLCDLVSPALDRSLRDAATFHRAAGGAPANVAAGLARLGVAAGFIGCVGDDPLGDHCAAALGEVGVDLRGLQRSSTARTTLAFVATRADGRKEIAFWRHPGADTLLAPGRLEPALFAGCRWFHFGSVSLACEPARSATLRAVELAREAGARISFDPNWRPGLWPDPAAARPLLDRALATADLVKVADEELEPVLGVADPEAALERLLSLGASLAVVTEGPAGARAATPAARAAVPGYRVASVDPLGAGDAFVAALLAELVDTADEPFAAADTTVLTGWLRTACAAGALATLRVGVIPALPNRRQVRELVASRPG